MKSKKDTIFPSLLDAVCKIEKETYIFYNNVNSDTDSVFADNKEFTKKYKNAYNLFSVTLADCISGCEPHVLSLTRLISESDKKRDADMTETLSAEFDRYIAFSKGVSDSIILVQNLLSTIQNYIKELQPTD